MSSGIKRKMIWFDMKLPRLLAESLLTVFLLRKERKLMSSLSSENGLLKRMLRW
jgi:hypothetical protein